MSDQTKRILNFWERWYPSFIAVILTFIFYFFCNDEVKTAVFTKEILNTCINISGIIFGFLLTVLALLLQSESKAILLIKQYGRFGQLIQYNKIAVYSAALTLILSFLLLITFDLTITQRFWEIFVEVSKYIWVFIVFSLMTKTYRYIDIFYTLIKE